MSRLPPPGSSAATSGGGGGGAPSPVMVSQAIELPPPLPRLKRWRFVKEEAAAAAAVEAPPTLPARELEEEEEAVEMPQVQPTAALELPPPLRRIQPRGAAAAHVARAPLPTFEEDEDEEEESAAGAPRPGPTMDPIEFTQDLVFGGGGVTPTQQPVSTMSSSSSTPRAPGVAAVVPETMVPDEDHERDDEFPSSPDVLADGGYTPEEDTHASPDVLAAPEPEDDKEEEETAAPPTLDSTNIAELLHQQKSQVLELPPPLPRLSTPMAPPPELEPNSSGARPTNARTLPPPPTEESDAGAAPPTQPPTEPQPHKQEATTPAPRDDQRGRKRLSFRGSKAPLSSPRVTAPDVDDDDDDDAAAQWISRARPKLKQSSLDRFFPDAFMQRFRQLR